MPYTSMPNAHLFGHSGGRGHELLWYDEGVASGRARHAPKKLPVEGVDVEAGSGGDALGLGDQPLVASLHDDVRPIDLRANRPTLELQPPNEGVDDFELLATLHRTHGVRTPWLPPPEPGRQCRGQAHQMP